MLADRLKFRAGQKVGCLVLRFAERYRVRVNGTVEAVRYTAPGQLDMQIAVEQAYDSCKKYVNVRTAVADQHPQRQGSSSLIQRLGASAAPASIDIQARLALCQFLSSSVCYSFLHPAVDTRLMAWFPGGCRFDI